MLIVNTCMASTMVMGVNHVNLSTNLKNPSANTDARVLCPVSIRNAQGPQWLSYSLGKCTGEQQFTRFTCSLSWVTFRYTILRIL